MDRTAVLQKKKITVGQWEIERGSKSVSRQKKKYIYIYCWSVPYVSLGLSGNRATLAHRFYDEIKVCMFPRASNIEKKLGMWHT